MQIAMHSSLTAIVPLNIRFNINLFKDHHSVTDSAPYVCAGRNPHLTYNKTSERNVEILPFDKVIYLMGKEDTIKL